MDEVELNRKKKIKIKINMDELELLWGASMVSRVPKYPFDD
jgi:hypothetical protein